MSLDLVYLCILYLPCRAISSSSDYNFVTTAAVVKVVQSYQLMLQGKKDGLDEMVDGGCKDNKTDLIGSDPCRIYHSIEDYNQAACDRAPLHDPRISPLDAVKGYVMGVPDQCMYGRSY